jgi:hypothetical protein
MKKILLITSIFLLSSNSFADYKIQFNKKTMDIPEPSIPAPLAEEGECFGYGVSAQYDGKVLTENDSRWVTQDYDNNLNKSDIHIILKGKILYQNSFNIKDLSTVFEKDEITINYEGRHYTLNKSREIGNGNTLNRKFYNHEICVSNVSINDAPVSEISFEPTPYSGCYGEDGNSFDIDNHISSYAPGVTCSSYYCSIAKLEGNSITPLAKENYRKTTWYNVNIENHIYTVSKGKLMTSRSYSYAGDSYYYGVCLNKTGSLW